MESPTPEQGHLNLISDYIEEQELPAEVYLISALVQSGQYNPEAHGLSGEHFMAYKQTHEFLRLYQQQAKAAPPLRLLLDKFPRFPYVPGVSAVWAAKQLHLEHQERHLRKTMVKVGMLISEGRIDAAGDLMRASVRTPASSGSITTTNAYEPIIRNADDMDLAVPVMAGAMTQLCQGILPGHLWFVAGTPGMGKSFRLMEHTVLAVEAGWDVDFYSLEMHADEVIERLQRMIMFGTGLEYGTDEFHAALAERTNTYGELRIHTGIVSSRDIEAMTADHTLIVVDYISKLRAPDGTRTITDYRVAGAISNELRDIATNCKVPILSAVQFNRSAYENTDDKEDRYSSNKMSMKNTSDTAEYNKDPDVMIGMHKMSESVILNRVMKNRHGVSGRKFYTRFTPGSARAVELSFDEAQEAMYEDAEKGISH